ncbi:hypothetical protein [Sediminibacillus albus]|uniref:Uncharacterized protein n=1 Tax=Sediminibacillus albus TaxID=407036 RepID=A0A1G9B5P2_9BACI|nr:hypothetical protein [Sediminibacillus albus]SDK34851.1 hypothetical protein SAMN05216243_2828 [Sediminibacillus albus]
MQTKTVTLMVNKKTLDLIPKQMYIYRSCKIIEAVDDEQHYYYLFVYKDKAFNGVRARQVKLTSFLHKAIAKGLSFSGDHPLTLHVLTTHPSFRTISFNQLYKKLSLKYSPLETALILTLFDAFISTKQLSSLLKKTYYQYRRNGQMLMAYKVLNIYADYDPNDPFAHDMLSQLDFQNYQLKYANLEKLVHLDPVHMEQVCFDKLEEPSCHNLLIEYLAEQDRWLDEIAVRLAILGDSSSEAHQAALISLMKKHFTEEERLQLYKQLAYHPAVPDAFCTELMDGLLEEDQYEAVVDLLITRNLTPLPHQQQRIAECFCKVDLPVFPSLFDRLNDRLIALFPTDSQTLERIVIRCISAFFQDYELEKIKDWLKPFHQHGIHLPIEQKLNKMQLLQEDPEQQGALGELYLYFHQPEKSIDCFKWEMELKPEDPKPVQLLSKVYLSIGNKDEAEAYQQLYLQMQR